MNRLLLLASLATPLTLAAVAPVSLVPPSHAATNIIFRSNAPQDSLRSHKPRSLAPVFAGGPESLQCFFHRHNRFRQTSSAYPAGSVLVEFTLDTTGRVRQAFVRKGLHPNQNAEAIRLVYLLNGRLTSASGQPASAVYTLAIPFPATTPSGGNCRGTTYLLRLLPVNLPENLSIFPSRSIVTQPLPPYDFYAQPHAA